MHLTDVEIGYLAGLMDGEGCIGYYNHTTKGTPYHSATLQIIMTDPVAITWVMETVGYGAVSISHPKNRRTVYSWQLCNKSEIREVLERVRPYLKTKVGQVDVLLALWKIEDNLPKGQYSITPDVIALRQEAADKIKSLKAA